MNTTHPTTLPELDRIRGCLLGGAIGDALGAGIEFGSLASIRAKYGPAGVTDFVPCYGREVAVTDDTQMTLFTAEGLVWAAEADSDLVEGVWHAYVRWYRTQQHRGPTHDAVGLEALHSMHSSRAPGNTCMSAVAGGRMGTPADPTNNSKGCGAVMRVAPVAFVACSAEEAWDIGCRTGALTHGHDCGWASAGALSVMIWQLRHGSTLDAAIRNGASVAATHDGGAEVVDWIDRAIELASRPIDGDLIDRFGAGWVGEEALAIAVACVLGIEDPEDAMLASVNHSGDSDSTGSIAGQLLGTAHGPDVFRSDWRERIELADILEDISLQLATVHARRRADD